MDIKKLAYAISQAETGNCKLGAGKSHNNCFGIMTWKTGTRQLIHYKTTQDSFNAFEDIWVRKYGGRYPTWKDAQKWTGNKNPSVWLKNVQHYYAQ